MMALLLILTQFVLSVLSNMPQAPLTSIDFPSMHFGNDAPSHPATTGYFINHLSINVKNLTASLDFYSNVFGLRHIFTVQASQHLFIAYMGHSQGGRNRTGYQTTAELDREKNNNQGLLEMIFLDVPKKDLPSSSERSNTFGHLGIVVPDIVATQTRLETYPGIKILKETGGRVSVEGGVGRANGFAPSALAQLDDEERDTIESALTAIAESYIFVLDPDANLIEVKPQE